MSNCHEVVKLDINKNNIIIGNHSVIDSLETFRYNLLVLINPDKIFSNTNYKSNEIYFQILFKTFKDKALFG